MVSIEDIKLPPHNIDSEKWVLWSILLDNEVMYFMDSVQLKPEDFYQKEHQGIFEAIMTLWHKRKTIDVITLADELQKSNLLEQIWNQDYLYELASFVVTTAVAPEYAKIVKEKSILRAILKVTQQIAGDVYDQAEVTEILDKIEKRIFELTQVNTSEWLVHIRDILERRIEEYMAIIDDPTILDKWKVNAWFWSLDKLTWWFKPWELIILAARPSMGKTAFALNLATNAALKQKKTVAIFSLEMGSEQISDRITSLVSEVHLHKMHKWLMDQEDFGKMWEALEKFNECKIFIDDISWSWLAEMKSKLRKLKIEKGSLDLVIIDYLQLMAWSKVFAWNRVQEISEISRGLKEMARELKIPVIALSQLSRAVEWRPDKRPQLSDLRESWAIEQDADMVMMLYREEYYDVDTDKKWLADVFIRKNRNGPTWEIELTWTKEIMKFYDRAQEGNY